MFFLGKAFLTFGILLFLSSQVIAQSEPRAISSQIPTGIEIQTYSLTGNPFFPPIKANDRVLFSADNRRLYLFSPRNLGFLPFPRRIQGPIRSLDSYLEDFSYIQLTNNTFHLTNSQGVLTKNITQEEFVKLFLNRLNSEFLLAPGGFLPQSDGSLALLDSLGQSWITLRIPNKNILAVEKLVSPTQILVRTGVLNQEHTSDHGLQLLQFFPSNQTFGTGEGVEITGGLSRSFAVRAHSVPSEGQEGFIGVLYDQQTRAPWWILPISPQGFVQIVNSRSQERVTFNIPGVIGRIEECVMLDQEIHCRTSSWQYIRIHFSSTRFIPSISSSFAQVLPNYLQSMRDIQNPFNEAVLQNPQEFPRYLQRLREQPRLSLEQINGLYRIFSYPLRTGQYLEPRIRLDVLEILSAHQQITPTLIIFGRLLRYEYDVQVGLQLIRLLEIQHWPVLYKLRGDLHLFLTRRASQVQVDHIEYLVEVYRRFKTLLLPRVLETFLPESVWTGLLQNQSQQRVRNLILSR